MATELRAFTVQIPAGTPQAAPVTIDVSFPPMVTESIEWHQPKGAKGLMGWRLTSGGALVIPKNQGQFIITDGQRGSWNLASLHDSGKWEVSGYNTGSFPHAINVRFHVSPIGGTAGQQQPFVWLLAGKITRSMVELGTLANAPEVVKVPSSMLWPPRGR